jgi:hypothetical protein
MTSLKALTGTAGLISRIASLAVIFAAVLLCTLNESEASRQEPQQQAPPPQPQPAPQPQNIPQAPAAPPPVDQRQQQLEQLRQEQLHRQQEQQRRQFLDELTGDSRNRQPRPQYSEPFLAVTMAHDPKFDLNSIPLIQWLEKRETEEIPWKVQVQRATLRMDQRIEVPYEAAIDSKDLGKLGAKDLYLIAGVSNTLGQWLVYPKVVHQVIKTPIPAGTDLRFSDAVLVQPGNYLLWLLLYDRHTGRHNVIKRLAEVSKIENDPLPNIGRSLAPVEFSALTDREGRSVLEFTSGLTLPVLNRRPTRVELISVLSPPEQWAAQPLIVHRHNQHTASVLNTLGQMRLRQGSISVRGLDLSRQSVSFEENDFAALNWRGLAEILHKLNYRSVTLDALEGKSRFLRSYLDRRMDQPADAPRVFIVISSSLIFQQRGELEPLKFRESCDCRVYHLRFRHNNNDVFDDLEKIMKPLAPKTFNPRTPHDFRRSLAAIIKEIESL